MVKKSGDDVSNTTVLVVLVLVILVSVVCLGIYINALNNASAPGTSDSTVGKVSLTIVEPKVPVDNDAKISLEIVNASEFVNDSE